MPPALAIYPDTFWKLTLPSTEAETPPSLLSSPSILFSVLGKELISLSLYNTPDSVTGRSHCLRLRLFPPKFSLVLQNR